MLNVTKVTRTNNVNDVFGFPFLEINKKSNQWGNIKSLHG